MKYIINIILLFINIIEFYSFFFSLDCMVTIFLGHQSLLTVLRFLDAKLPGAALPIIVLCRVWLLLEAVVGLTFPCQNRCGLTFLYQNRCGLTFLCHIRFGLTSLCTISLVDLRSFVKTGMDLRPSVQLQLWTYVPLSDQPWTYVSLST